MFRKLIPSVLISALVLTFAAAAAAQFPIGGQVVDVIDGKTIVVAIPSGKVKVELQYIDVPEAGQDLHDTIKAHLEKLLMGKAVVYRPRSISRDKAVGQVTVRDLDISEQMLRDGAAWHLPRESSGQDKAEFDAYAALETAAKNEKLGVWSIPGLRPAWEFRAQNNQRVPLSTQNKYAVPSYATEVLRPKTTKLTPTSPLGNVGALANGYDPESRTGYVGTTFLEVGELDAALQLEQKTWIDISYYYKLEGNKRKGMYVFSLMSAAKKWRFLTKNNLILVDGEEKETILGRAKRTSLKDGDDMREKMVYEISRATLERIVTDDQIKLKVGTYIIRPIPSFKYVLYNLLQVSQQ